MIGRTILLPLAALVVLMGAGIAAGIDCNSPEIHPAAANLKSILQATHQFRKTYGFLPGDLPNPKDAIAGCRDMDCLVGGDGNGIIGVPLRASGLDKQRIENATFWTMLRASGLLKGTAVSNDALNGGLIIAYHSGTFPLPFAYSSATQKAGHYLILTGSADIDSNSPLLTARQAATIDRNFDDGAPETGDVLAAGLQNCVQPNFGDGQSNIHQQAVYGDSTNLDWLGRFRPQPICAFLYIRVTE